MKVRIARTANDIILLEAEQTRDREVCGLLIGQTGFIEAAVPMANVAPDSRRMFEIDPAMLLSEHRRARVAGHRVLGHYHSHPGGKPVPSLRDAANAHQDGALWVIATDDGALAAFCAIAGGVIAGRFDRVDLEIT